MKRLIAITLILAMVPAAALSDLPDISDLTYEELVQLKDQINLAMWECEEWQEVRVPQGVYQIGVDIPAGHWTIKATDGNKTFLTWFAKLDASGRNIDFNAGLFATQDIVSPLSPRYDENQHISMTDYNLEDGQYLIIESGSAIFTPYEGKPDLGFKK